MMKLDTYWTTNPDWYEIIEKDNGKLVDVIKDDAPPEAKASYARYEEQITYAAEMEAKTGKRYI